MTKFDKSQFKWDGMYLMYWGRHTQSINMEDHNPNCHPSWVGKPKPSFIARFKYGSKPWKSWVNCIVDNYPSVESYLEESARTSPLQAVQKFGYSGTGRYKRRAA